MHRNWHDSRVPILDHHMVAALDAVQTKPKILEGANGLPAIQRRKLDT
jgi:hypothetical protein